MFERSKGSCAAAGLALACAAAMPVQAAVVFRSAEVSVFADVNNFSTSEHDEGSQVVSASQPGLLLAEAVAGSTFGTSGNSTSRRCPTTSATGRSASPTT